MWISVWFLGLFLACPGKSDSTDDSDSTANVDDSTVDDSGIDACPAGPGEVKGVLIGSDGLPLASGKVILWDSTGSTDLTDDNVDDEGAYQIPYGKGDYQLTGEYGDCTSADIAVTLCGEQTVYKNIELDCAP